MQIIEDAINESKHRNRIVTLDKHDCAQAHVSVGSVRNELAAECEGSALNGGVEEFWGSDCGGSEWRVHVEFA